MFMWIDGFLRRLIPLIAAALLCLPAMAGAEAWTELTPIQQETLAPLSKDWDTLAKKQQQHFLRYANHYPKLTPEQKERLHKQLVAWSKLTPEQRRRAREKHQAFSKVPQEKRELVKKMVHEREVGKVAASGVPASIPTK